MKILMTGFTKQACKDTKRPRIERLEPSTEIAGLLRRHGWDVEQRPVIGGEDWSDIDVVWVSIGSKPDATGAKHAPGGLWALHQAVARGIPTVVFFDDWNLKGIKSGFGYVARKGAPQLAKTRGDSPFYANAAAAIAHADAIIDIARQFGCPDSELWRHAVLTVNRFQGWGDLRLLNQGFVDVPIVGIDLTPLILRFAQGVVPCADRERHWVLASLTKEANQWTDAQRLQWSVRRYGWASKKQPVLSTERAVVEEYAQNWGVLCPSYYHAGSGWFRTRLVFAAAVGAIVLCGREDARALGPAYQVSAAEVEQLPDAGLRELAIAQRATIGPLLPVDEADTLREVEAVIAQARR